MLYYQVFSAIFPFVEQYKFEQQFDMMSNTVFVTRFDICTRLKREDVKDMHINIILSQVFL